MLNKSIEFKPAHRGALLAVCAAALLSACGGGGDSENSSVNSPQVATPMASGVTTLHMAVEPLPDVTAALVVQPLFHVAPALLSTPDDGDAVTHDTSAHRRPHQHHLSADVEHLSSRRLTVQSMKAARHHRAERAPVVLSADAAAAPMAATGVISTYTPAQIRSAYGLPLLPAAGTTMTTAQAAQMGAGQTIYIVDAMHDPNIAAELAAFNTKFGLPACTTKAIAVTASLPLATASKTACEFSVVYNTASATMTAAAPAYDAGWATEITLDVQWAHATAPLARIILIEAADASLNSLLGAIKLANVMGPGIVSMSFGANEGNYTASVDAAFGNANMTYLAATGDSGAAVSWPAVSPNVVAVGGTTLTYTGTGARSEVSWSGTGGGTSLYTPTPSYQTNAVPGMGTLARRTVADVAFNADPASGQYVAVLSPGSATVSWLSVGGTSLSTPQWAGLIAVANATRAQVAKPILGAPHAVLYGQIATVPGNYASVFADVTKGTDGTCATCTAKVGYDPLSGLGTPNVTSLLSVLSGTTAVAAAPVVTAASISGKVGTALSFTVAVTAPNPVTYSLIGAPAGMAISAAGVVTWATPLVGTFPVTVIAKDSQTALSGQGLYTVTIAQQPAPVVTAAAISGKVGTALSFTVAVSASNPVTYTLSGAPVGMAVSTTGVVTWAVPVAGTYSVTAMAKDTKTGLSGQGVYTIAIAAPLPPVVSVATINGKPGAALSFTVAVVAPNPVTYTLTGAPAGMSISSAGVVSWASPVLGTFAVTVVAKDTKTALSGQGVMTVKIATAGPVITALAMKGVLGKPLTGTISITDSGAISWISVSISGVPLGMSFSMSGLTLTAVWPSPVVGSYSLKVSAVDSLGLSSTVTIPVTVTAK
ncbi:MAG: S53 family peptidase [Rhodoferax sp.]|uniref:S53 family peptidase n=1 Tax=Rhodoferax sp. TaxID=50421 RepID=UPI00301A66C3